MAVTADTTAVAPAITEAVDSADAQATVTADTGTVTADIDQAVAGADATVTPDAVTEQLTLGITDAVAGVDANVTPDADTAPMVAQIEDAASSIPPVEVTVDADTSGVDSALDETSNKAEGLGKAAGEAAGGVGAIAPAAALAAGETGALRDVLGEVTPGMAGAAGAAFGLVAAGKQLFESALEENTALARLRETFGGLADEALHINLGGINEDLEHLAVRVGADDEGLKNFTASFGQLGKSAGDSSPHILDVSKQIELLAVRASVLNPNLGTADEIVGRLSTSLARGGRFLSLYGISLSTAQINAEALRQTGKQTSADLSIYDKIVAGATLATQGLGNSLGTDINNGAQKAEVRIRSIRQAFEETAQAAGRPLLAPVIHGMEELLPVAEALARILGVTLSAALKLLGPLLGVVADVLGPIGDLASEIPQPVLEAALAFAAFAKIAPLLDTAAAGIATFVSTTLARLGLLEAGTEAAAAKTAASATQLSLLGEESAVAAGPIAAIGVPIAAAAALAAAAGFAYAKWTDNSKQLNAGVGELHKGLGDVNKGIEDTITKFSESQVKANDAGAALRATGLDATDLGRLAIDGKKGYHQLLDELVASGRVSQQAADALRTTGESATELNRQVDTGQSGVKKLDDSTVHLVDTFQRMQGVTRDTAHEVLTAAVAHGQLSREEEVAAIQAHTAANGHVDWIAVLSDLRTNLGEASQAQQQYGQGVDATNPKIRDAAQISADYNTKIAQVGQTYIDAGIKSGQFTASQVEVATALNTNKDGTVDYKGALNQLQPGLGDVAEASGELSGGLDTTAGKFALAKAKAAEFQTQLDQLLAPFLSADQANVQYHQDLDKVTESLAKNGAGIDINTKLGQENRTMVDSLIVSGTQYIDKLVAQGASQDVVKASQDQLIGTLRQLEQRYPSLTPLIQPYIDKLNESFASGNAVTQNPVNPQVNPQPAIGNTQAVTGALDNLRSRNPTNIGVNTDTAQASRNVNELEGQLRSLFALDGGTVHIGAQVTTTLIPGGSIGGGGMAGKEVKPFEVFPVNEQIVGPQELFVSATPGRIVSKADALAAIRDAAGGDGPAFDMNKLLDGLAALVASQRPVTVNEVAHDPEATAFAVAARMGQQATR